MKATFSCAIGSLAILLASALHAAPAEDPKLEAVMAKLPAPAAVAEYAPADWTLKNGGPAVGVMSIVDVEGMPFKKAIRMESRKRTDRDYMFQAVSPTKLDQGNGDVLLLTFYARSPQPILETNVGQVNIRSFSMKGLGQAGTASAAVGKDWQKFYFAWSPFSKKQERFAAGEMTMTLNQGMPPQIVEIADIKVAKFGPGVKASDLPRMVVTYEGREPDAPWRKEAIQRIEKIRKGDVAVQVTDAAGRPLAGAQVHLAMKRHAFKFGAAYADHRFVESGTEDSMRYREEFLKLFNFAVSESGLKWEPWLEDRERAIKAVKWMRDHNIPVRGHTLVWCQLDRLPYAKDDAKKQQHYRTHLGELQKLQVDHIRDEMGALKGMIHEWDLINEAMTHWDYYNLMGMDCFLEYFKVAHEVDPAARLLVNENKLLNSDGGVGQVAFSREEDFYKFLKHLKDKGAPLAGIGIQSHWGGLLTPPARMLQQLDRFAEFGTISITEFSNATDNEQLQADVMRDFLTMCFSHPAIDSFTMWGFWDGQHFRKNAPIFRKDWSLKPSGEVYKDLVFKQWWTDQKGVSSGDGRYQTRGFLGEYELTVTHNGRSVKQPLTLTGAGTTVKVPVQ